MQVTCRSRSGARDAIVAAALLTLVVLAVVLGACGGSSGSAKPTGTPTFTDPSKPIAVKVGQQFEVRLAANATTGYSWRVGQTMPALVTQIGSRYVAPKTGRVGAGGTAVIRFRASTRGKGGLGLAYVGPGTNGPTARTVTFQLDVS